MRNVNVVGGSNQKRKTGRWATTHSYRSLEKPSSPQLKRLVLVSVLYNCTVCLDSKQLIFVCVLYDYSVCLASLQLMSVSCTTMLFVLLPSSWCLSASWRTVVFVLLSCSWCLSVSSKQCLSVSSRQVSACLYKDRIVLVCVFQTS